VAEGEVDQAHLCHFCAQLTQKTLLGNPHLNGDGFCTVAGGKSAVLKRGQLREGKHGSPGGLIDVGDVLGEIAVTAYALPVKSLLEGAKGVTCTQATREAIEGNRNISRIFLLAIHFHPFLAGSTERARFGVGDAAIGDEAC
jgi:hypothetical protein